jgi:xylan 1,4-beta-xylosidase
MVHNAPVSRIQVACDAPTGELQWWRHALSHGGISPDPLPPGVVAGLAQLRPRRIRIFLQEFFAIYPEHDVFDWTRLDPHMDALAATGADIVAAITIKPRPLFPAVDDATWMPNDVAEWQRVIHALVTRYSVERNLVTHWEVGNETDIGEHGGSPYLIPDPEEYGAFYAMTVEPILAAFPEAKVGGPAACWVDNEPLPGLIAYCQRTGTQLDFISWHLYSDDPDRHAFGIARAHELLQDIPAPKPELFITEWARGFPHAVDETGAITDQPLSVEEAGFDGRAGSVTAAIALAMLDAGVDWAFYYHVWDQACDPESFRPFFSDRGVANMVRHWNEVPHRFGFFGVNGAPRPQYFVFQMLGQVGTERLPVTTTDAGLHLLAGRDESGHGVMIVNHQATGSQDRVAEVTFTDITPGRKRIVITRVNDDHCWQIDPPHLIPVEVRDTFTESTFACQAWSPGNSVTLVRLEDLP